MSPQFTTASTFCSRKYLNAATRNLSGQYLPRPLPLADVRRCVSLTVPKMSRGAFGGVQPGGAANTRPPQAYAPNAEKRLFRNPARETFIGVFLYMRALSMRRVLPA